MHPDMTKLLDLQSKDLALAEVEVRLEGTTAELRALDDALAAAQANIEAARQALAEGERQRDELEAKVENYRVLQERRRQRLEFVRNQKEAASLMAELDLARSVMADEENAWVRAADAIGPLNKRVADEEARAAQLAEEQRAARDDIATRRAELEAERDAIAGEREASAARVERTLRVRYDRLRRARATTVVVPLRGGACSACHTAVPVNRRTQIRTGAVIEGCEACGALLYAADAVSSA